MGLQGEHCCVYVEDILGCSQVKVNFTAVKELVWLLETAARETFLKERKVFGLKKGPGEGGQGLRVSTVLRSLMGWHAQGRTRAASM